MLGFLYSPLLWHFFKVFHAVISVFNLHLDACNSRALWQGYHCNIPAFPRQAHWIRCQGQMIKLHETIKIQRYIQPTKIIHKQVPTRYLDKQSTKHKGLTPMAQHWAHLLLQCCRTWPLKLQWLINIVNTDNKNIWDARNSIYRHIVVQFFSIIANTPKLSIFDRLCLRAA